MQDGTENKNWSNRNKNDKWINGKVNKSGISQLAYSEINH